MNELLYKEGVSFTLRAVKTTHLGSLSAQTIQTSGYSHNTTAFPPKPTLNQQTMCFYLCVIFNCEHQTWGRRVKPCQATAAETPSSQLGLRSSFCPLQMRHGLRTIKVQRKCKNCANIDLARSKIKETRDSCYALWPNHPALRDIARQLPIPTDRETSFGSISEITNMVLFLGSKRTFF